MPRPWIYRAYGLTFESSVELPALTPGDGDPDVRVHAGAIRLPRPRRTWAGMRVRGRTRRVHLVYDEVGACLVTPDEVVLDLLPAAVPSVLQLLLIGPVTGILLQLRGLLVLHAAAVEVEGRAVVIAGNSGMGKSTTAAALVRTGGRLLADDVVAIDLGGAQPTVPAGSPHLRLMPESLLALGEDPESLPRLRENYEKRQLEGAEGVDRVPLGAIFVLEEAALLDAPRMAPSEALRELLVQSYCADLLTGAATARHFRQCGTVAASVPVYRLHRPRALGRLAQLADLVAAK